MAGFNIKRLNKEIIFTIKYGADIGVILFGFGAEVGIEGTYVERK